ncbi:deoxyribonuclease [Thermococci archaeon]|nr:MAG: deoxyribonuclease [Thermococci archaeon]
MIDAHAHVELFKKDIPLIIQESREKLKGIVDSITEYRKFHIWRSWELLKNDFDFIFPTLGYAPNEAKRGNWEKVKKVERFILEHSGQIYAVGEIGLDFYYARTPEKRENQRKIFEHFLELAVELNKPVVLHARDAEREVFEAIQRAGVRAYFHSYSGDVGLAREIAENGHFIGINTGIGFIPEVRDVAAALEIEGLLVETDAPYMSPFKGEKNKPWNVKITIEEIAKLKNMDFEEVERKTEENTVKFFDIPL